MRARATRINIALGFAAFVAAGLPFAAPAQAVTFNLCASPGTVTMPDGVVVNIWGFSTDDGGCAPAQLPGPVLIVEEGEGVTVNLTTNTVGEPVTLEFPGQEGVAVTGTSYTFAASAPGTYLYEAGTNPGIQIPMGLYGALIVRPAGSPGQAYGDPATAFDVEQVLVLSEIDPELNNLSNPNTFDRTLYNPVYWLINGEAYPDTDPVSAPPDSVLLLRYLNAGSMHHTMTLLGLRQRLIAVDSDPLVDAPNPNLSLDIVSHTIPSGQTADALVDAPAAPGRFALYNRQMRLTNALPSNPAHFPGGMLTFVTVPAQLFFATVANTTVPGVLSPFDNADIYAWSGAAFARVLDGTGVGLSTTATIDALLVADFDTFYMSFATDGGTTVPTLALVQDEDIVKYDAGTWSLYFDGSAVGLGDGGGEDVDAFEILGDGSVLISTRGAPTVPGLVTPPSPQDEDLLHCVGTFPTPGTCMWSLYFEGSDVGLSTTAAPVDEDIDGVAVSEVSGVDVYLSTVGTFATSTLSGESNDVLVCNDATTGPATSCTSFSLFLDASAEGLGGNIGALDLP